MKRLTYSQGVEWIALNDAPGDHLNVKEYQSSLTVCLLADLFGHRAAKVAKDVFEARLRLVEGKKK